MQSDIVILSVILHALAGQVVKFHAHSRLLGLGYAK